MKKVVSFSFSEIESESTLLSFYYESKRHSARMPGWSIGGIDSAETSPQPTPGSSPKSKKKSMLVDMNLNIEKFANLRVKTEEIFPPQTFGFHSPSMASLEETALSRSSTLLSIDSFVSSPYVSAEELRRPKSQPIPIIKGKNRTYMKT